MVKALVFLCLAGISAVSASEASAQDAEASRIPAALELNTDMMMFSGPSSRFFLGWQRNVNVLFQAGLDGVTGFFELRNPDRWFERLGVLAVFSGASLAANRAFSLTAHDASHMEAARTIGATSVGLVREDNGQPMGIGEFFLEAFNFTAEPGLYWYFKSGLTWDEESRIAGEGLDTNMLTASAIGTKINEGEGHVTDLAPYILNKTWGIGYLLEQGPTSDGSNYVTLLDQHVSPSVTATNIVLLQVASCMLSGGFLSLLGGTWGYLARGDAEVAPLELEAADVRVFWPEVTTWLNKDNVSVSVLAEAAWKRVAFFSVGVDTPVLGNLQAPAELTFGARGKIQVLSVGLEVTTGFANVPFVQGSVGIDLGEHASVGLQGHYGQGNTMRESREYPLGPGAGAFVRATF
jgi:hypothetical protein